ncbi:GNAT family N-acetyltransferase [Granulicella sp. 5B5]|uniref:GNAT family N-acetyltransferase n=1 Tax=Granulicella sp. 5B5 TaxID=1617967 RepID=UPI0015F6DFBA|nr:GNAT family N-acetyltransferase [Granulicella sp. 5B5]QMV17816.1 GNAT family N-acetyltransferase [Granulicella sp. 5B5]
MLRTPPTDREAPTLETARLRLRAHTLADFPVYCTLWADPDVVRYIGGKPNTAEELWARLLRNAGHWSLLGFGSWLVEERATGKFVGEVGLFNYQRMIEPPLGETPEIGWILSPSAHGRGYATEAVKAILAWADGRFVASEAACLIHPENAASLHVAGKCGFTPHHTITYRESLMQVLVRPFGSPA